VCGINGIFAYHYAANPIDRNELRRTCDHMAARGPDGTGEWISADERVGFGHRRLAIIDLSDTGIQPMASADGKLVVTFNGEIFHDEDLQRRGTKVGRGALPRSGRQRLRS
jgi:asparagine synthase (glutamine-hydrolysing)